MVDVVESIDNYIELKDWKVRENSNMTYSVQSLNHYITTKAIEEYWLNRIYPPEVAKAHKSGDFHIHDLGFLGAYCVGWDLYDLLLTGFGGVKGKVHSKPAKHFRAALGQIVNFFYTLQGEAAGAQAFSDLDVFLAPFIAYDGLDYDQVKQAMQEFIFNLNVPTRVGFQTPFTNITLDLAVPKFMQNDPIIIGGEVKRDVYGDFADEVEMFNKAFAEVMMEGDGQGRVFTFPIPTYNVTKDFPWDSEVAQHIWKMTAKYGIPYFANFVSTDMNPEDVRSMCCHLRLETEELRKRGGGLFGSHPLTGSIGVVTINMARLGYLSRDEDEFFERLLNLMELAKTSLEIKRKAVVEPLTERGLYPYSKFYLRGIEQRFGEYWKNHFSTIGLIGMNEALLNLFGVNIVDEQGLAFAEKVLKFMRKELIRFQEETGNLYNLEATPAEGASYRLALLDKQRYPDIIVANEDKVRRGAKPYYTNSTLLPVDYTDDLFTALKNQERLQPLYTGGTVFHIYLGESNPPADAVKRLVKKAVQFDIPYLTVTPTFSVCPVHGYLPGEHKECPKCKAEGKTTTCEVYSRVVGYIRPVNQWNDGKQAEFEDRKVYDKAVQ